MAVSAAVLTVFSDVKADMGGDVTAAKNLTVETVMDFGTVQTINIGVAAGAVGVNASVSTTYFGGTAQAGITGDASIKDVTGLIKVNTEGTTDASVAAAALAAGSAPS